MIHENPFKIGFIYTLFLGHSGADETCTFEPDVQTPCSWSQVSFETVVFDNTLSDGMDWSLGSRGTPSGGTGPNSDHTPGKGISTV